MSSPASDPRAVDAASWLGSALSALTVAEDGAAEGADIAYSWLENALQGSVEQ